MQGEHDKMTHTNFSTHKAEKIEIRKENPSDNTKHTDIVITDVNGDEIEITAFGENHTLEITESTR